MSLSIHVTSVPISASTTTANAALPTSTAKYLRFVNGSTALAYINAGVDNTVAATSANIACRPSGEVILERNPNTDLFAAVLLSTGTGTVTVSPCAQAEV